MKNIILHFFTFFSLLIGIMPPPLGSPWEAIVRGVALGIFLQLIPHWVESELDR